MPIPWITNRYLTATYRNYTRASTIGNDVAARLANRGAIEPAIQMLSDYFDPINAAYQAQFAQLDAVKGLKKGATYGLQTTIAGMRSKANSWRKAIANVYDERSEEYMTLLPKGIGRLTQGKQASIMQAIDGLSSRLTGIAPLSAIKTDVEATLALLDNKNSNQKGKIGARNAVSDTLELERINLCNGLLYVEFGLGQLFVTELSQVDAFFPIELLRRRPQTEFTGNLAADASKFIVKRKQKDDAEIRLNNAGDTTLTFYFAPAKDTPFAAGMPSKIIAPMQDITMPAPELGASDENVYLIVKNNSDTDEGRWVVAL